ncbi:MAG: PAS domain S-box protein, partial [Deltaproteobacteria bacterium]
QWVLGVFDDITLRRQEEAKLQEALNFNREIISSAREGIIVYDRELHILIWNPFMEEISGFMAADVIGKHPLELFPFHKESGHIERLEKALKGIQVPVAEFQYQLKATGKSGWASDSSGPLRNANGEIVGVIGTVRDITEQRMVEDQLRQSQKLESLGRLAGGVAHDFNNKLTVIMGYAELVRMHFDDPKIHEHLNEVIRAAEQSRDITSQLLAFSRQQTASPQAININSILADLRKSLGRLIGEDISIFLKPAEDLWTINIDPVQFDQIIMNLTVNARDAMPGGGAITIETFNIVVSKEMAKLHDARMGEYVSFIFRDNGTGMDAETCKHIFEPFFTTKEQGRGTGLGLATIYGIVSQNGGFIDVESTPGTGTAFNICLPRYESCDKLGEPTERPRQADVPATILLVEDEEPIRKMAMTMLESLGHTCIPASDPLEALELFNDPKNRFDLVLTDIVMPKMNGREMLTQIKAISPKIKGIYMSGFAADIIPVNTSQTDESLFIKKPFKMNDLAKVVRSAMKP